MLHGWVIRRDTERLGSEGKIGGVFCVPAVNTLQSYLVLM